MERMKKMTKTNEKRPGAAATVQSADPKDQLHSTTSAREIQALHNRIFSDLSDLVAEKLSEAKVILNDQSNLFFYMRDPETEQDRSILCYAFSYASIRHNVVNDLIRSAANGLADIMERLDTELAEGRERDEG